MSLILVRQDSRITVYAYIDDISWKLRFLKENLVRLSSMKYRRMSHSKWEDATYLIHVGKPNSPRQFMLMQSHQEIDRFIVWYRTLKTWLALVVRHDENDYFSFAEID